jgi:universal stress protein E
MGLQGPILAATDFSDESDAALRQGSALASALGTSFTACHVLPEAFRIRVLFPHHASVDRPIQRALEHKALDVLQNRLEGLVDTGHETSVLIESGTAHAGILAAADRVGAGVIVVGPGVTAQRLARAARGPLLVARPSPTGGAVLGATDFSDPAVPALRMAAAEATRRQVRLRLVHCLDADDRAMTASIAFPGATHIPLPAGLLQAMGAAARLRLREGLAAEQVSGDVLVLVGPPGRGIVDSARDVATGLVVVGARGRTGISRLTLGSVAEQVMAEAPCSVLVVPLAA